MLVRTAWLAQNGLDPVRLNARITVLKWINEHPASSGWSSWVVIPVCSRDLFRIKSTGEMSSIS